MADIEKIKAGIYEMLLRCSWDDIDKERHRFQPVLNDALELLKERQARVVTLEEIHNRDVDCVWIEYDQNHYRTFVIQPGIFHATTTGKTTIFACGCGGKEFYDAGYNVNWRAWTARPTDEQRKDEQWKAGEQE